MDLMEKINKEIQDIMKRNTVTYELYLEGKVSLKQFGEQMELNYMSLMDIVELGK